MRGRRVYFLILLAAPLLAGCMVGPDYCSPCVESPSEWRTDLETSRHYADGRWWEQFGDPVLTELIEIALMENQDLLIAADRVEEFLGLYHVTRAELFPQLGAEGSAGREKTSYKITPPAPGIRNPDNFYRAFLSASWELDIWGRIRRASQAARADVLAAEEARQGVIQSLVCAVATGYIDLLRLDRQLEIAVGTAKTRAESLELFQKRHKGGVVSAVEVSQVESEYQEALALIPEFERFIAETENGLNILLGLNPGAIPRGGTIEDLVMPQVPEALPSELLFRRPDIREAEHLLVASNARIGVARAAYFPSISLTGAYGTGSRELSDLFGGGSSAWNYFVDTSVPIFTAGRISGQVRAAEAVRAQRLEEYQRSIIVAFGEVEDALVGYQKNGEQVAAQRLRVEALEDYNRLARLRYDEGYASYLEVLDANRSLFGVELDYTETRGNTLISIVDIYKALGGGWIEAADELTCY